MRPLLCHLSYAAASVDRAANLQGYETGVKRIDSKVRFTGRDLVEHGGNEVHGDISIVTMEPSLSLPRIRLGTLATGDGLADDGAP
jgi:hypothetical protein